MTRFFLNTLLCGTAIFLVAVTPVWADEQLEPINPPVVGQTDKMVADVLPQADMQVVPVSVEPIAPPANPGIVFETQPMVDMLQRGIVHGVTLRDPEGVYKFYKSQGFGFFWTNGVKATRRSDKALEVLENSWMHGFNPANYHVDLLKQLIDQGKLENPLEFEVLMSDAVARYGRDMTGIRVSAKSIGEDTRSWMKGLSSEEVLTYISQQKDPDDALEQLHPPGKLYPLLQDELKNILDDMKKNPDSHVKQIAFPGLIYPHRTHPTIKTLRERFDVQSAIGYSPDFYDDALIKKIQSFQKANGLKPDGIVGQRTIDAINQGRKERLIKVLANLERLRWMNAQMPDKYILVNVPAMTLWAFENEKIMFEMPVIVGKPDWPTTSFRTDVTGIRFNPSWYVPPSIQTKDLLPELRKNPDALTKKNLQLLYYTSDGAKPISPRDVKWDEITEADLKNFAMIQNPGDENPLGKIRVLMPNQYNIYLHDTNSPDLFTKDFRALSHGCIRLAEPRKVADFILDRNGDWSEERLNAILAKKNTIEVAASEKIPVFILYQTIWQNADGDLIYGQDIYGSDEKLVAELSRKEKLPLAISFPQVTEAETKVIR